MLLLGVRIWKSGYIVEKLLRDETIFLGFIFQLRLYIYIYIYIALRCVFSYSFFFLVLRAFSISFSFSRTHTSSPSTSYMRVHRGVYPIFGTEALKIMRLIRFACV